MSEYFFEVTLPSKMPYWRNPDKYAEMCGLVHATEGTRHFFAGDILPIAARHFADHLDDAGFQYIYQKPSLALLQCVNLANFCLTRNDPMRAVRPNLITRVTRVERFGDLPQCSFSSVIARAHQEPGFPTLPYLTEILRFMIEYEVEFNDLSPCEAFRTPIGELGLTTRVTAPLVRAGFRWAELLLYVSAEDILTIDQMGSGGLKKLEEALGQRDMHLLPG